MSSPREDAPLSTKQQSSPGRETNNGSPPRRPDMGTGCALLCFHMPSRPGKKKKKKKKKKKQPGQLAKLGPGSEISARDCCYASEAAASQRVTFLASASLSTWWPSSPSAGGHDGAWRRAPSSSAAEAAARGGGAGARMRALSSSFSYWRRSQASSSRVMPHGAADLRQPASPSFSFPSSPVSVSSCLSTPRISHGCPQE